MKMGKNLIPTQPLIFQSFKILICYGGSFGGFLLMKNVTYFNDIPGVSELLDEQKFNVLKGTFFEDLKKTLKN
jgi:hypothetical protein